MTNKAREFAIKWHGFFLNLVENFSMKRILHQLPLKEVILKGLVCIIRKLSIPQNSSGYGKSS